MQRSTDQFDIIEKESIKILTRNANKNLTLRFIHDELVEDMDIKDPIEKESFKNRLEMVLRYLPAKYDYINISVNEGILSASFSSNDDKEDKTKNDPYSPDEKYIIRFIVDEGIKKYYSKKDFRGNNILHYLVLDNDYDRILKIFDDIDVLFIEENNEGLTPIQIIKDIRISNLFINHLIENNLDNKYELMMLNNKLNSLNNGTYIIHIVIGVILGYLIFDKFIL